MSRRRYRRRWQALRLLSTRTAHDDQDAGASPLRPLGPARLVATFVLVFAMGAAWALSVPTFSAPDEHAHVIRASGLYRGDVVPDNGRLSKEIPVVPFTTAPSAYADAVGIVSCYLHDPASPASCAPELSRDRGVDTLATLAGRYPPLYYAGVGAPSRLTTPSRTVYGMRILSAAAFALLMTAGLAVARGVGRAGPVSVFVAATPISVYLGAMVNPNGFEIAAALATWAGVTAIVAGRRDAVTVWVTAASASLLMLARGLSPLWVAAIAFIGLIALPRNCRRLLVRDARVRLAAVAVVVSGVVAGLWMAVAGVPLAVGTPLDQPAADRLRTVIGRVPDFAQQTIGELGFLDAPSPTLTYGCWLVALAVIVGTALLGSPVRFRVALVAVVVVGFATAVALETYQSKTIGLFWQGRYTIPIVSGLPILAAVHARVRPWVLGAVTALVVAGQLLTYVWTVRRYSVGDSGPLAYWTGDHWSPPIPVGWLLVLFAVGAVGLGVVTARDLRTRS